MSMVIQHNIPALQTYNIVNSTSNALQKSIAKLSSGLRINSAADDAAGLAISEKMRSQIRGLDRAIANTQDGISLIQTAEGALGETHSILQRMRELSVQAANDTLTQQDRSYIQEEIDQLKEEVTRIGNTTQFNKKKLLNGDSAALWSSDDLETKAIINGGLRDVDQFGQKKSIEGNYKISVKADPGQGEVQKSDIMKVKHPNVLTNKTTNLPDGVKDVEANNLAPGTYSLTMEKKGDATKQVAYTGAYGIGGDLYSSTASPKITIGLDADGNVEGEQSFSWEIGGVDLGTLTFTDGMGLNAQKGAITDFATAAVQKAADAGITLTITGGDSMAAGVATLAMTAKKLGSTPGDLTITASGTGASVADTDTTKTSSPVKTSEVFTITNTKNTKNASVLFEVTGKDSVNGTVTVKASATILKQDGTNETATKDNIVLKQGATNGTNLTEIFGGSASDPSVDIKLAAGMDAAVEVGGKFTVFVAPTTAASNAINVDLKGQINPNWDNQWTGGVFGTDDTAAAAPNVLKYNLDANSLSNTEVHFRDYILNEKTGDVTEGDIKMSTNSDFNLTKLTANKALDDEHTLASFKQTYIGEVANGGVKLRDLDKFWNSEGTFMIEDAKTLTLNQGDGKTANVTLYANDTLNEVAKKINDAIATGLGQSSYVDDPTKFAVFAGGGTDSEAVAGTFVIRSVVPGKNGEITFSGDQGIIDALSLNTIQNSKETEYNVSIKDAHSGSIVAQNIKTTGNVLHGVLHENVDIEFSALKGITANWNGNLNKYVYTASEQETTLHLADNTTVLQVGANEGEDIGMNIGDMRAHALGLDGVNVMSHDRAARSITVIDNAIDKVSTQRANLGAYQNRLEYTASNLTTASENLTSAESRIRDADMAKEMMEFTKLNIMLQAGNSMLAQANQQPQNVLSLIR